LLTYYFLIEINKLAKPVEYFKQTILDMGSIPIISTVSEFPPKVDQPIADNSRHLHIIINNNPIRRRYGFRPKPKPTFQQHRTNERIRAWKVLVIDEDGKSLGEMTPQEGMQIAKEKELDLVEVFPKANPPVCKIQDYGKYQYQQSKQDRLAKARQKKVETKGIRIGIRTDDHDLNFKKNQADKFLKKGDKVKIEIILKGREKAHQSLARETLSQFVKELQTPHRIEEDIKRVPGGFIVIIAPE
jgi:translation initiation factor IF-3